MSAPRVTAKARNHNALAMKQNAFRLGIPIFEHRALARALYDRCETGAEIGAGEYRDVADLYFKLHASKSTSKPVQDDDSQDAPRQ